MAITAIAYYSSLHTPFIFDDRFHIVENAQIRSLWPIWTLLTHSSRPLVLLSLACNYALGGLNPWGYHAFNAGIHGLAALVLYGLIRRTLLTRNLGEQWQSAAAGVAGLAALLWVAHPLQTESVTYTIQRGESMMGLFYLLTIYCIARLDGSSRDIWWKSAAVFSCALGIGCKGVIATAPLMALLYDRAFLSRSWAEVVRLRKGLYAALAATCLLFPLLLANAPAEWQGSSGFSYTGATPLQYAATQPGVLVHYLRLAFWPDRLCLDYGSRLARSVPEILLPLAVIGCLLSLTIWAWIRRPALGFLGAWFFLILAPTSSFLPIADIEFEHRMYLSLAALATLTALGLTMLTKSGAGQRHLTTPAWIAASLMIVALTSLTIRRNADYSSELAMWRDTVNKSPDNPRAQYDLGVALEHVQQLPDALTHYELSIRQNPTYVDALNNAGHLLSVTGKPAEGAAYLYRALEQSPNLAEAHCNLGYALAQLGKTREAAAQLETAIRLRPTYAVAHSNLGIVLAMSGKLPEAIPHWERAVTLDPDSADSQNNLAYALAQVGSIPQAISHYEAAVRIKPDYAQAEIGLAKLLATSPSDKGGDPGRAVTLAANACELTGNRDPGFLDTLAIAYAAANRFDDAIQTARRALELAHSTGQAELARDIDTRLGLYQTRRTARAVL